MAEPVQVRYKSPSRTREKSGDSARRLDRESSALERQERKEQRQKQRQERLARSGARALLTLNDVADRCAVSYWTVRDWIDTNRLPVVRFPGRLVRVRAVDFEAFLEAHREKAPAR